MQLETFCINSRYTIIPRMALNPCYITYDYSGMTRAEINTWKDVIAIAQVRRAKASTPEEYLEALQNLGIRAALVGTAACDALRVEYNASPMLRRMK